ncbi:MAG: 1-deoxy-D-xylulose-5-phosphate synthase [Lachnospiraceae bacterium]|nr:1-deoxy-D-xylulose-5-phosphate synthase [Lachnospiraceae bacterium]
MSKSYKILNNIKSVSDIKELSYDELDLLAREVRDFIIESTSKSGGHLASSLGVVELTIALIKTYNFPIDKIIWDVGHQSYAYKILTDRKDAFYDLRSFGGISGFPKRKESPYDSFDTGHSSTSISAGLGMCVARDLNKMNYKVVTVIGDGALTGGMAFEALNNLSNLKSNYVVILNDNEMSISKNEGGLNKALIGVRSSKHYSELKNNLKKKLEKTKIGLFIKKILVTIVNIVKQISESEGMLFENLDINYVGPIDGHNIKEMTDAIQKVQNLNEPVIIHIKTVKGKGYKPAEDNPTLYHGVGPFNKETGELLGDSTALTYTKVFSNKLVSLAKNDDKIVAITAAMTDGTGLKDFSVKFPDRFFDVGICEQHAVTFASGIALSNIVPVVCIYSSFLQRAFDQIIHDVCLQNQHVVFAIDRAGLVGADGETHQGIFDISYLRLIPNMTILAPKNAKELEQMIEYAIYKIKGPVAIRYPRGKAYDELNEFNQDLELGKSELLFDGSDVAIFALGSMVSTAVHLRNKLKENNITSIVVNARFAKPIDLDMIDKLCSKNIKKLIVLEEGVKSGGIGSEIEDYVHDKGYDIEVILVTIPDAYVEHGDVSKLRIALGIDSSSILKRIITNGK